MSEHIAVQKGKLVSSSGKNRKKKKKKEIGGGCGGVFLQIFNGKRLFSWKSLPEGMKYMHMERMRERERYFHVFLCVVLFLVSCALVCSYHVIHTSFFCFPQNEAHGTRSTIEGNTKTSCYTHTHTQTHTLTGSILKFSIICFYSKTTRSC